MGLPPTPPSPVDLSKETPRPSEEDLTAVLLSGKTVNPLLGILGMIAALLLIKREKVLEILQKNGFLIVILTLGPLILAAITSRAGKSIGNMTPWEPSKIPFLIGFAAILAVLYKNLAKTYWGLPRAKANESFAGLRIRLRSEADVETVLDLASLVFERIAQT